MTTTRRTEREVTRTLRLERAARGVEELRRSALAAEQEFAAELDAVAPSMRESACNLVHYLAVRRHDIRQLQDDLARLGLSSLGRMEAHVMASLCAVREVLDALRGRPVAATFPDDVPVTFDTGDALLAEHANAILGPPVEGRGTRIMVTMPGEAADDRGLIRGLVDAGMRILRINGAHDDQKVWERMVKHLRKAEREAGKRCLVSFDLAGPKLRTGPMAPGSAVVKWRPTRDAMGRVIDPARVRLVARIAESDAAARQKGASPSHRTVGMSEVATDSTEEHSDFDASVPAAAAYRRFDASIPVDGDLLAKVRLGDTLVFTDTRDRKRTLQVVEAGPDECLCAADLTAYVVPGTRLDLRRKGRSIAKGEVGPLRSVEQWISLHPGDMLDIVHGDVPGRDAVHDDDGNIVELAIVSCPLPEVFRGVRVGEPILLDDGKFRGTIRGVVEGRLRVEIESVAGGSGKLKAEKGINLPESDLAMAALTAKDVEDLAFVARHADMVALSFVQRPEDIDALMAALQAAGASGLGIVLKIETQAAFERLPGLLLAAMRNPPVAVMVARGDLGVEVGFERLSEVQEEILWLCEAAHVPVIWATQVLESLAKGGMPSRAEVTDAAMGSRAECVMLNKGPFILETLRFLIDVLRRMEQHQYKKTARLRKLRVSDGNGSRVRRREREEAVAKA